MSATPPAPIKKTTTPTATLTRAATRAKLTPAALEAVKAWLGEQFLANMYAKLGQVGEAEGDIALRRVFVDLPVVLGPNDGRGEEDRGDFLLSFLKAKPIKLGDIANPQKFLSGFDAEEQEMQVNIARSSGKQSRNDRLSATLLIGGPGQGKSTLGQLACQLHRAALLQPFTAVLSTRHQELLASFYAKTSGADDQPADLAPPTKPFLPLQVSLPDLASWLAKKAAQPQHSNPSASATTPSSPDQMPLILQFLAERPSAQSCKLAAATLLALAAHMPVLLVLDGFDEVGAGNDRARLVAAARELLVVLAQQASTIQVLATTRPQGYAGELAQIGVPLHACQLALLKKDEALRYAAKLVHAKIPGADDRHQILARLEEAANEPATQRLLTTPLQVTILSSLVQQAGRAPRERWNLFEKYFTYTYTRETVHNTYASNLLANHRQHIVKIHARVALLLQVESERDGGAAARMSQQRLEEVIDAVLLEDGIADEDRLALVREITVAAGQRLVFLVEPEPGSFGFEIRSLQEFMAAWALTSGRDNELEERLRTIANAPMFRNVVLFIASRFFSEGSSLRDVFAEDICPGMNNDAQDELARLSCAGSLLALEILEEGAVLMQPKRARALMACACGLLNLPPDEEHLRLVVITNKDTYPVLQQALEGCFTQADQPFLKRSAWFCLLLMIDRELDGAIVLAERYWPQLANPVAAIQDLTRQGMRIGAWLAAKIESKAEQFSPADFIQVRVEGDNWAAWLSGVFGGRREKSVGLDRHFLGGGFFTVAPLSEQWSNEPEANTLPTAWLPWILAARFEAKPSASALTLALQGIADLLPQADWERLQSNASWPLGVCLRAANDPADLHKFAQQAQMGILGDTSEWLEAEKKWHLHSDSLRNVEDNNPLWTVESLKRCAPLLAWKDTFLVAGILNSTYKRVGPLAMIDQALQATASHNLQNWLLDAGRNLIRIGKSTRQQRELRIRKWLRQFKQAGQFLIPKPEFLAQQEWLEALDTADEFSLQRNYFNFYLDSFFSALNESECHPKVLRAVVQAITINNKILGRTDSTLLSIKRALQKFQPSTAHTATDWRMLQLYAGMGVQEQDNALVDELGTVAKTNPTIWREFIVILGEAAMPPSRTTALLGKLWTNTSARQFAANEIIALMRKQLQKGQSGLDNHIIWNRLGLRLPHPLQTQSQAQQSALPSLPIHISALELKNIRALHQLKLTFPTPPENLGQWVVILGQNGVGKTTLLRSLALALRNAANLAIWPKGVFSNNWLRTTDSKESQIGEGEIVVMLGNGDRHTTTIRQNGSTSTKQHPEQERARLFPVFGYGCRRGSALSGEAREVKLTDSDGPEISTLFDDDADLIHAETWFRILESDAQKEQSYRILFDAVKAALIKFLDLDDIEIKVGGGVWITEKTGLKLPFKDLSDGYLTSAGWFLDLIARWIELAKQNQIVIEADFMTQMRGLVLIDEIDLHLHPRWQIEIIDRTRNLLPQMSFIVTTHNPLTLVGAKAQEIWILARENGRIQAKMQGDTPMLLTGGQIYRRYFGIEDIYPNGLGTALQRYSFLCGYALRTDDEQAELIALQIKLAQAGIMPDWDVVPRTRTAKESK